MDADRHLARLLAQAEHDPDVLAVVLFGSRARGDHRPASDVDVCRVLDPGIRERQALAQKRLAYLAHADLDDFAHFEAESLAALAA